MNTDLFLAQLFRKHPYIQYKTKACIVLQTFSQTITLKCQLHSFPAQSCSFLWNRAVQS